MKKQTAVEWFWDKMKSHFEHDGDLLETATFTFAIAKEKEKEQVSDAVVWFDDTDRTPKQIEEAFDQYYKETYGEQ